VVAAVAGGMSRAEAARRFAVNHSSAPRAGRTLDRRAAHQVDTNRMPQLFSAAGYAAT
jgi:hypothetical protein